MQTNYFRSVNLIVQIIENVQCKKKVFSKIFQKIQNFSF